MTAKQRDPITDITAEELESRLSKRSTTDDADRKRCPHDDCGSLSISPRNRGKFSEPAPGDWYCTACGRHFDEPARGESA